MSNSYNCYLFIFAILYTFSNLYPPIKTQQSDSQNNRICDISKIENKCKLGATYCTGDNIEFCTSCEDKNILASPYKNVYKCINIDFTLCSNSKDCLICKENGKCLFCNNEKYSYNGECVNDNKCSIQNCSSCEVKNGKEKCNFCSNGYYLCELSNKCIVSNITYSNCAVLNEKGKCSFCNFGYLLNVDQMSCREYNKKKSINSK